MSNKLGGGLPGEGLIVQEHRSSDAFGELEREWRLLESHAATPFVTWDWSVAWWAQLREEKLGVTDSTRARITHHVYRQALHAIDSMPALRRATISA